MVQEVEALRPQYEAICRQYRALVGAIERQAADAARALGFEAGSLKQLRAVIRREMCKEEYPDPNEVFEQYRTAPREWDRAGCINLIEVLLDIQGYFAETPRDQLDAAFDNVDAFLRELRRRLPGAMQ